tara:strand:+ start:6594 stop:7814 length:1221 start_codon:yes stop_codon:yes gene_type:complete
MLKGTITLKGDKSISHRILIFASLAKGDSEIYNLSECEDVKMTLKILQKCNIRIIKINNKFIVKGNNLSSKSKNFYCGNSGSTARFMLGFLPFNGISGTLYGDESLSKRPMRRITNPLKKMGLNIIDNNDNLPISFKSSSAKSINYNLEIPSAQIKTSMIFAALTSDKRSYINDSFKTRNHTEKILQFLGNSKGYNSFNYSGFTYRVPGDISNASFIISAALLMPGSNITIKNILFNNTRTGYIKILKKMGAKIKIFNKNKVQNEVIADINIMHSPNLCGITLDKNMVVSMIDEIPIFALVASFSKGQTILKDAEELRYKESDRIKAIVVNLKKCGTDIIETKDGFLINPSKIVYNTSISHFDDHRIAMTFEILKLVLNQKIDRTHDKLISTSFTEFYNILEDLNE